MELPPPSKGTIHKITSRGGGKVLVGTQLYPFFVNSWQDPADKVRAREADDVQFVLVSSKVVAGTLIIVSQAATRPAPVPGAEEPPRLRDWGSFVAARYKNQCISINDNRILKGTRKFDRFTRQKEPTFGSVKEFLAYMETDFAKNASSTTCVCCNEPVHAAGEPLTFDQYYGVTSSMGRFNRLQYVLDKKRTECKCTGWVFPHPPNNVFRRTSKEEHETIVKSFGNASGGRGNDASYSGHDSFLLQSGVTPGQGAQLDLQINHLVPKSGGGCPRGRYNLQANGALCPVCRELDREMQGWQAHDQSEKHKAASAPVESVGSEKQDAEETKDARHTWSTDELGGSKEGASKHTDDEEDEDSDEWARDWRDDDRKSDEEKW